MSLAREGCGIKKAQAALRDRSKRKQVKAYSKEESTSRNFNNGGIKVPHPAPAAVWQGRPAGGFTRVTVGCGLPGVVLQYVMDTYGRLVQSD
jgi:hypothetical protein